MLRQFQRSAVLTLAMLATAGCGIKGPLVLPPAPPSPVVAVPAPAASSSTPASAATSPTPAPAEKKP
ncbi:MAG: lipoprotein [Betaproteobacteria bacterium]